MQAVSNWLTSGARPLAALLAAGRRIRPAATAPGAASRSVPSRTKILLRALGVGYWLDVVVGDEIQGARWSFSAISLSSA